MQFFTESERHAVLERVTEIARSDNRVTGGALVGSYASNDVDRYSDIDITFGVKSQHEPMGVLDEWTEQLKSEFDIVDLFDVQRDSAIYRVILFSNGLELDLSVVPESDYGPLSPHFTLLFGEAVPRTTFPEQPIRTLIGWGWHHVLHANSAINRMKLWQAAYWISGLRDCIISMKCIRLGLPSAHARGADRIDHSEMKALELTLVQTLNSSELKRVLPIIAEEFVQEVQHVDMQLSTELQTIFQIAIGA